MPKTNMKLLVKEVVDHFGGAYKLAGALDVSSVAVCHWVKRGRFPARRALQIQYITEGKFDALDLVGGEL
jgi:DNA-binding transcriptional regulator YdaS (Cro superfamily)